MNRNILTLAMLGCAPLAGAQNTQSAQNAEKPNFALFIADDCSYYDLGCYGSKDSVTPNIDGFAKEGMLFSRAYQAVPMSSPTRHNLYTGIWPVRSGAYPNHTFAEEDTKSIVHQLKPQGYKVALIGKSHISPKSVFPFDLFVPADKEGDLDFKALSRFIDECIRENTPYCLLVASNQPHSPWNKGDTSRFKPESLHLPPMYVDIPETRTDFSNYLAEINYMDNEFGTLLSILDDKKQRDNTMVVYLSEQGNSLPFAKWTCYDAGVHSACIVRWPGKVKPGTKSDAIVEYVDIVPTFVDIAGGEPVEKMDGESFKNVLLGQKKTHKKYTFSMQTTRGINKGSKYYGIRSVCDGRYRYIVNLTPEAEFRCVMTENSLFRLWEKQAQSDPEAKEITQSYIHRPACELYDIRTDPYCLDNLAGNPKYSKKIKELSDALTGWMEYCGDKGQETEMKALEHQVRAQKEKARKSMEQGKEIFFADPTVFVQDGTYYLTGTRNIEPLGFQLLKSDNMRVWKEAGADTLGLILRKDHSTFGDKGFWAPQILKHDGKYLLTYTASEQTVLAESGSLEGPYTQDIVAPIDGSEKNIDSFLFKDDDGKYYLYHVRFNKGNYIWAAEFDIEKGKIRPETLKKCFDCTEPWEWTSNYKSMPVMEGPTVIKKNGVYYLFYSANHFRNIDYAVGYATAPTPYGPWTKNQNSPIIHRSIVGENGSGHGDLFQDKNGRYWYVYHVHHSNTEVQPRRTRLVPLTFTLDEKTGIYDIKAEDGSIIKPVVK